MDGLGLATVFAYGHCVQKKFWFYRGNVLIFSLYFSDLIDFLDPSLLLFLVEYQEYWWVRQQVPLSTISWSLLPHPLFKSFSLSLSTTKPLMRDLCPALHFIFIWTRSRLCQCSSQQARAPLLSDQISLHSELVDGIKEGGSALFGWIYSSPLLGRIKLWPVPAELW